VHVRKLVEGTLEMNEDFRGPLFECLLCKACVTTVFPPCGTDKNVIAGRAEYLKGSDSPGSCASSFIGSCGSFPLSRTFGWPQ